MNDSRGRRPRTAKVCLMASVAVMAMGVATARAQEAAPAPQQMAQAATHSFSIPAQPLSSALTSFGRQAGLQITVDSAILSGLSSPGLSGNFTPQEALARLLSGTGITWTFIDSRTVALQKVAGDGATVLDTVVVEGNSRSATGPVAGFVAGVSAAGTKTDTPLIETPQSISVVTRDEMDARAITNVGDALTYTAGVAAGTRGGSSYGGDSVSIRGFGSQGTAGASFNEYMDGMRLGGSGYVVAGFDAYLFERIEVLKGPASVLYGQSSPGGIVNMVSRRPTFEPRGEISLQYGTWDRWQGAFNTSGPLDQDGEFAYSLTGLILNTDTNLDYSNKERYLIAPALTWRPSGDTTLTILAQYQHDDFRGSTLNWLPTVGTIVENPNGQISRDLFTGDPNYQNWDRTAYSLGYILDHHFDDVWSFRQHARFTYNRLSYGGVYISRLAADLVTGNRQAYGMQSHSHDWTLDNQVQAQFETGALRHTLLMGVDGQILASDSTTEANLAAPPINIFDPVHGIDIPNIAPYTDSRTVTEQYGLYMQDQIRVDDWAFLLGVRHDWAVARDKDAMSNEKETQNDSAFTFRGGIVYLFDNGLAPYASYTESFEPQIGNSGIFDPTTGQQFEVGLKYEPPGMDSLITLAAFELTRQNVLSTDPTGTTTQSGEVRSRGIELEGKATLVDGLSLTASYTYLDAEVTQSDNTVIGYNGLNVREPGPEQGKTPVAVPEHAASLWLDYTVQSGGLEGVGLGAGVRYVGETYGDKRNTTTVPGFTLVDAALRYDLSNLGPAFAGWETAVNATNLFDKEYIASCTGPDRCYYGTGRNVIGTLKYKW